jgi:hypothetical protein
MHKLEHFVVVAIGVGLDSIVSQGLGRTAPTLVQGGDESRFVFDLVELLIIIGHGFEFFPGWMEKKHLPSGFREV